MGMKEGEGEMEGEREGGMKEGEGEMEGER